MALRKFPISLSTTATGSSLIKTIDPNRGMIIKGVLAGNGISVTSGANDLTVAYDPATASAAATPVDATNGAVALTILFASVITSA